MDVVDRNLHTLNHFSRVAGTMMVRQLLSTTVGEQTRNLLFRMAPLTINGIVGRRAISVSRKKGEADQKHPYNVWIIPDVDATGLVLF